MSRSVEIKSESIAIKDHGWFWGLWSMGMTRSLESVNVRKRSSSQRRAPCGNTCRQKCLCRPPNETPSRVELLHAGNPYRRIERPLLTVSRKLLSGDGAGRCQFQENVSFRSAFNKIEADDIDTGEEFRTSTSDESRSVCGHDYSRHLRHAASGGDIDARRRHKYCAHCQRNCRRRADTHARTFPATTP